MSAPKLEQDVTAAIEIDHGRLARKAPVGAGSMNDAVDAIQKPCKVGIAARIGVVDGPAAVVVRAWHEEPVHRAWFTLGERLLRVLQRQAQGRTPERRDLLQPSGSQGRHRAMAHPLQYKETAFGPGIR